MLGPKSLLARLAWQAIGYRIWTCKKAKPSDVGKAVLGLPPEEREIIRQLKASDIENDRLPNHKME